MTLTILVLLSFLCLFVGLFFSIRAGEYKSGQFWLLMCLIAALIVPQLVNVGHG